MSSSVTDNSQIISGTTRHPAYVPEECHYHLPPQFSHRGIEHMYLQKFYNTHLSHHNAHGQRPHTSHVWYFSEPRAGLVRLPTPATNRPSGAARAQGKLSPATATSNQQSAITLVLFSAVISQHPHFYNEYQPRSRQ